MFFYKEISNLNTDPYFGNVSLLLRGAGQLASSGNILDESSNAFSTTIFGHAGLSSTTKKYGSYSMKFDGNGDDYLSLPTSAAFQFGTGDFTVETWVYLNSYSADGCTIFDNLNLGGYFRRRYGFVTRITNTGKLTIYSNASYLNSSNGTVPTGAWTHIAFVRQSGIIKYFINGVLDSVTPSLGTNCTIGGCVIGVPADGPNVTYTALNGYLDDLRITKGVARYTASFTPPTEELPASSPADPDFANVSLLLRGTGTALAIEILDESSNVLPTKIYGDVVLSSAVKKYGSYGIKFDGNTDYLQLNSTAMNFGSSDFTIESWVLLNAMPTAADSWPWDSTSHMVIAILGTPSQSDGVGLLLGTNNIILQSNDSQIISAPHGMTTGVWYHVAATRNGNTLRLFVNGILKATNTFVGSTGIGAATYIGSETGQAAWFNGYIDDLRITKGVARYTANFTPPTEELPAG